MIKYYPTSWFNAYQYVSCIVNGKGDFHIEKKEIEVKVKIQPKTKVMYYFS